MPRKKRHITEYPLTQRIMPVFTPIKCIVCLLEIKKGEWYYRHSGHETHKDCVQLQSYGYLGNNDPERGATAEAGEV
jgi:hypothetical protein